MINILAEMNRNLNVMLKESYDYQKALRKLENNIKEGCARGGKSRIRMELCRLWVMNVISIDEFQKLCRNLAP